MPLPGGVNTSELSSTPPPDKLTTIRQVIDEKIQKRVDDSNVGRPSGAHATIESSVGRTNGSLTSAIAEYNAENPQNTVSEEQLYLNGYPEYLKNKKKLK